MLEIVTNPLAMILANRACGSNDNDSMTISLSHQYISLTIYHHLNLDFIKSIPINLSLKLNQQNA